MSDTKIVNLVFKRRNGRPLVIRIHLMKIARKISLGRIDFISLRIMLQKDFILALQKLLNLAVLSMRDIIAKSFFCYLHREYIPLQAVGVSEYVRVRYLKTR